jgi:hypothetical protein
MMNDEHDEPLPNNNDLEKTLLFCFYFYFLQLLFSFTQGLVQIYYTHMYVNVVVLSRNKLKEVGFVSVCI